MKADSITIGIIVVVAPRLRVERLGLLHRNGA